MVVARPLTTKAARLGGFLGGEADGTRTRDPSHDGLEDKNQRVIVTVEFPVARKVNGIPS